MCDRMIFVYLILMLMLPSKGNNYDEIVNIIKNKKIQTAEGVLMQLPITDASQHSSCT